MFHFAIKNNPYTFTQVNQSTKGFVFFILMLFLQVFALMSLFGWMHVAMSLKRNNHLWQRERFLQVSETILKRLNTNLPQLIAHCSILMMSSHSLSLKPISWWQSYACSGKVNDISYYDVVEALGKDHCGIVKNDANTFFISDYYRITLLTLSAQTQIAKIILQATVVKTNTSSLPCNGKLHFVKPGIQMWREI